MANEGLRAELASLEAELRRAERINQELQQELGVLVTGIIGGYTTMRNYENEVHSTLDNASGAMIESNNRIIAAHEMQGEIDRIYVRYKQVELANKKIRAANNRIYYDFAAFRMTRRIVQSLMDNLETGFVSDKVMYKIIEKEQLKAPDYWLTAALVAVMAWRNDNQELTERAVARAVTLDKKMTCIFFMMFNIRCDREAAALEWFKAYQSCSLTGSDDRVFLMLVTLASKSVRTTFSESGDGEIVDFFEYLIEDRKNVEGYSDDGVASLVTGELSKFSGFEAADYPQLLNKIHDSEKVLALINGAGAVVKIHDFYARVVECKVVEKNERLKEFIDEIVAVPNSTEIEAYEEIEYNELIIAHQGDIDSAKAQWALRQAERQGNFVLIDSMLKWIFDLSSSEIDDSMRRQMLLLTIPWHKKGVEAFAEDYRKLFTTKWQLGLENYDKVVDFDQEDKELKRIESYFSEKAASEMAAVKDTLAYASLGGAAVALILGIAVTVTQGGFGGLGFGAVISVLLVIFGLVTISNGKNERKRIQLHNQAIETEVRNTLKTLVLEFSRFRKDYEEKDAYAERAIDVLGRL